MAKGINIQFVSDVRGFLSGTKDVQRSLDDVADSLDDLGREATKAGEKLGDELKDGGEKGEDAAKGLERKFRDALDTVRTDSRKAGDDLGDSIRRGADKAGEGLDNFKEEARDTARETAASFDGSADSLADMFQETAANALSGFGPAGAAAGLAIAAGAGVAFNAWQEKTERIKEAVSSMFEDMLESGNEYLSESYIQQAGNDWLSNASGDQLQILKEAAEDLGMARGDIVRAINGDQEAQALLAERTTEYQKTVTGSSLYATNAIRDMVNEQNNAADSAANLTAISREAYRSTSEDAREWARAQAEVDDAVKAANDSIAENNKTLTDASDRARENGGVLADLSETLGGVNQAAAAAGKSGSELTKIQQDQAAAFINAAREAGLTAQEAYDLAHEYKLIPDAVDTEVKKSGVNVGDIDAIKAAWDRVPNQKTTTYTTRYENEYVGGATGSAYIPKAYTPPARASGGPVAGGGEYLVGEHGPEIFRPSMPGKVVPNAQAAKAGPVELSDASIAKLAAAILAGASRVSSRTVDEYDRGRRVAW